MERCPLLAQVGKGKVGERKLAALYGSVLGDSLRHLGREARLLEDAHSLAALREGTDEGQLTSVQRFTISAHYIVGVAMFAWQRVRASVDGRLSQP
jgi:hypothetical protein